MKQPSTFASLVRVCSDEHIEFVVSVPTEKQAHRLRELFLKQGVDDDALCVYEGSEEWCVRYDLSKIGPYEFAVPHPWGRVVAKERPTRVRFHEHGVIAEMVWGAE
jgi:hypothetical protein